MSSAGGGKGTRRATGSRHIKVREKTVPHALIIFVPYKIGTSLPVPQSGNSEYARKHVQGIRVNKSVVKSTYVPSVRREFFALASNPSCCRQPLEAPLSAAGVASPGVKPCQVPHRALDHVDVYSPIPSTGGGILIEVGHRKGS